MAKKETTTETKTKASFTEATKDLCEVRAKKKTPCEMSRNERAAEKLKDRISAYERLPEVKYLPVPATLHFSGMPQPLYDMIFDELAHGHAVEDISKSLAGISTYCIEIAGSKGGFRIHGRMGPFNRSQRIFLERDMKDHLDVDTISRNWGMTPQTVNKYAKELGINMVLSSTSRKGKEQRQREKWQDSSDLIMRPHRGAQYVPVKERVEHAERAEASLWDLVREKTPAPIRTSKNIDATPVSDDMKPKKKGKTSSRPKGTKSPSSASSKPEVAPEPC